MTRVCTKCGDTKAESEFYFVTQRGKTRLRRICKECFKAQPRDHTADPAPEGRVCTQCNVYKPLTAFHKHKICLYGVEPMCKECRLEKRRAYGRRYPERIRNTDLMIRYGISLADYETMFARQEGRCAICGVSGKKLVVDHNHTTGKVRALLCHHCNTMIGSAREDITILLHAAAYLYAEVHPESARSSEITFRWSAQAIAVAVR